ncbi:NifU family protein [Azotobacter sp. CWF10]
MSNLPLDSEAGESAELPRIEPISAESLPLVRDTIERLRPGVQRDGGDLELVAVQENIVRLRLKGACVGCAMSAQTLGGVRRALVEALGNPSVRVLPAP